jgi:cephalosporin hydroxylase
MRETHSDELGGWRTAPTPTIFDWAHLKKVKDGELTEEMGFAVRWDYPLDTLVRCTGTGSACILIHRSVFERIEAEHGPIWYNKVPNTSTGQIVSEDLSFCLRAGALNIPVHVHTGVRTTHMKPVWVAEEDYWAHRAVTPAPGTVDEHNRKFELPVYVDLAASSAALAANEHDRDDMLKFPADLDRYRSIIDATRPDVVVETGTRTGGSARWFADLGVDVVTVDVNEVFIPAAYTDRVTQVVGDSTDPTVVEQVQKLVAGRRAMVSLDSDHSGPHVSKEIAAYGPMVTPGCYLVVEDAIFGYAEPPLRAQHGLAGMAGSPLDSIVDLLVDNPDWSRDVAVERAFPVSSNPAGWWRRNE